MFDSDPITEIVREYGGMEAMGGVLTNYPTMSSRYGDFAREGQQQQTSSGFSQRRNTHEIDCHVFSTLSFCLLISRMFYFIILNTFKTEV